MKQIISVLLALSTTSILFACANQQGKGYGMGPGERFVSHIFKALSYLDIKADDISDIKMSAGIYRKDVYKIMMDRQFPVEAFGEEDLDEKKFLAHCESEQKKMALAKFDFLDAVYTVLSKEQKAQFLKEMKSVVNMKKFGGNRMGMGMRPAACDGKGPKR